MTGTKLTERIIRGLASEKSFQRGGAYLDDGAVSELVQRGGVLTARVEGSEYAPYLVTILLDEGGVADADCSCPYDWGGYCKHIVSVLLSYVRCPDRVVQRPPVADLLGELDRDRLIGLLLERLEADPGFADWIEARISVSEASVAGTSDSQPAPRRRTMVDPEPIRQQAQNLFRRSSRRRGYWDGFEPAGNAEELQRMVESAVPFLEAGDGRNALRVLEPIAEAFVEDWIRFQYEHDEDMYLLFGDLGGLFADAILTADLSGDEREGWAVTLEGWQEELDEHDVDDGFQVAIEAAARGWDDPDLQRVLKGQSTGFPRAGDDRWTDIQLTASRLRVLERQARFDEYLHLSSAAGYRTEHAGMLARLDRAGEAVAYGLEEFEKPNQALDLAMTLQEHGEPGRALEVAGAGLGLSSGVAGDYRASVVPLARWLRVFAAGMGGEALALRAANAAFRESLALDDYQAVEGLAGEEWPETRSKLLAHLAAADHAYDRTEIYLFEDMVEDAVRSIGEADRYHRDDTLMKVAEAAFRSHPDWVIGQCRKQAESIMDDGRAKDYATAAKWLEIARRAYHGMGRQAAWSDYLGGLIGKHVRKHKLRPLLEELG